MTLVTFCFCTEHSLTQLWLMSCQLDSDWWKIETPSPTPAPEEQEEEDDEEEEEEKESGLGSDEGELDSVGLLFHTLLDNDTSVEQCSL